MKTSRSRSPFTHVFRAMEPTIIPSAFPLFFDRGEQPVSNPADILLLLRGRPELFSEDLFLKRQPAGSFTILVYHATSAMSSYTGPRGVSVLFLSLRPETVQLPQGASFNFSRHRKSDGSAIFTRASVAWGVNARVSRENPSGARTLSTARNTSRPFPASSTAHQTVCGLRKLLTVIRLPFTGNGAGLNGLEGGNNLREFLLVHLAKELDRDVDERRIHVGEPGSTLYAALLVPLPAAPAFQERSRMPQTS